MPHFIAFLLILLLAPQRIRADTPYDLTKDFGMNLNDFLINPMQPGHTEQETREQVASSLYVMRMIGARTVRWLVPRVYPQYACSPDPEDQATGELDRAWFTIAQILLEEAQKQNLKVVVVLAETSSDSFVALPKDDNARHSLIQTWSAHGKQAGGKLCDGSFKDGYYGHRDLEELFADTVALQHLTTRFMKMTEHLVRFSSLGAIELFNEPDYNFTHKPQFSAYVAKTRILLQTRYPALKKIPVYSGTAWWDGGVVAGFRSSGALDAEPYLTLHPYRDYTLLDLADEKVVSQVRDHLLSQAEDVRKSVPGKALIFAEFGSTKQLLDEKQHAGLVKVMYGVTNRGTSVWPWGSYVDPSYVHPYSGQTFSPIAISGPSFSPYFINEGQDAYFKSSRSLPFTKNGATAARDVSVSHEPDDLTNSRLRARYTLAIGSDVFVGVSRSGVFPTAFEAQSNVYAPAPAAVLLSATSGAMQWVEIVPTGGGWRIDMHTCAVTSPASHAEHTPDYVNGFATILGLPHSSSCGDTISSTATVHLR